MKSETCVCLVSKSDKEVDTKCDHCGLPINMTENPYAPTTYIRWFEPKQLDPMKYDGMVMHWHSDSPVLRQKWVDNRGNFKWIDVPTVKEE